MAHTPRHLGWLSGIRSYPGHWESVASVSEYDMKLLLHRKLWRFIEYLRTSAFELTLATCILWWCFVISAPHFQGLDRYESIAAYSGVAAETSKGLGAPLWTALGVASALVTLFGLFSRRYTVRKFGVLLSSFFWATLFVAMWDYPGETGTKGMFAILWVMCLISFILLGIEQRAGRTYARPDSE